jgi:flagellar basal-body rod protein FlgG
MSEVLAVALHSLQGDMGRVESVAMNLANSLTPGYKRSVAVAQPFASLVEQGQASSVTGVHAPPAVDPAPSGFVDVHPGPVKKTGQALDLALGGPGFFEVLTDDGPAYTRKGDFHMDERGRLVTAQGLPVMGLGGEIALAGDQPTIARDGAIVDSAGGSRRVELGQLKVVRFEDTRHMTSLGNGLYTAGAGSTELRGGDVQVQQGFLENSNVSTQQEMVELMQTTRHFESVQKAIQAYDELMGTAIQKLSPT